MSSAAPLVPQGRTEPPSPRSTVMVNARDDFNHDDPLNNTTSLQAYVDLKLRDSGYELMTDDEAREFSAR